MTRRFLTVAFAVLGLAALPTRLRAEAPLPPADVARTLVEHLSAGRFEDATGAFDDTMRGALPARKLAELWKTLQAQAGAYDRILDVNTEPAGAHTVALVGVAFAQTPLNLKIAVDGQGRVAGLFVVPRPAEVVPERSTDFVEREVTVGETAWPLPGLLTLPAGAGPFPAVVLVHGSGPNDRDETLGPNKPFRDLAHGLARKGVAVLRYDKRTRVHGGAGHPPYTVDDEVVEDAASAVRLLRGLEEIDGARVFVLGHSLGGTLAPRVARAAPEVAGLIILAGATRTLQEALVAQLSYLAGLDGTVSDEERMRIDEAKAAARAIEDPALAPDQEAVMGVPASYWLDLRGYDPAGAAAALGLPMLVLHGGRDYQVTGEDLAGWRAALGRRDDVTFREYPKLNHLFMSGEGPAGPAEYGKPGHVAPEVIRDVADWIGKVPAKAGRS